MNLKEKIDFMDNLPWQEFDDELLKSIDLEKWLVIRMLGGVIPVKYKGDGVFIDYLNNTYTYSKKELDYLRFAIIELEK